MSTIEQVETEIAESKANVKAVQDQIAEINVNVKAIEDQIAENKAEIAEVKAKLNAAQEKNDKDLIIAYSKEKAALHQEKAALHQDKAALHQEEAALTALLSKPAAGISKRKHFHYKRDAAKVDTRLFLDEIASKLYEEFPFNTRYHKPTFGDVKHEINKGNSDLENVFSDNDWALLLSMHRYTNTNLPGVLPRTDQGTYRFVVPREFCDVERIRGIAIKAHLITADKEFDVLDDMDISSGSENNNGH